MKFTDIPLHEDAKVPFLAEFDHNCEESDPSILIVTLPMNMTGGKGEKLYAQYLNDEDKETATVGHVGESFYAVTCQNSNLFPLPYGSALKFIKRDDDDALLDIVWLADLLLEGDDPFDLRAALGEEVECDECGKTECECKQDD